VDRPSVLALPLRRIPHWDAALSLSEAVS
jgi:hypothetical protein